MARLIGVESLVLVQEVVLGEQAGVEVAARQVDRGDTFVVDMDELTTGTLSEGILKHEQVAVGEDDMAAVEGGVFARLAEEEAREVDGAALRDPAEVVHGGAGEALADFPLVGEAADQGLGAFVDLEGVEILLAD